jgi:hypothetical protein
MREEAATADDWSTERSRPELCSRRQAWPAPVRFASAADQEFTRV